MKIKFYALQKKGRGISEIPVSMQVPTRNHAVAMLSSVFNQESFGIDEVFVKKTFSAREIDTITDGLGLSIDAPKPAKAAKAIPEVASSQAQPEPQAEPAEQIAASVVS